MNKKERKIKINFPRSYCITRGLISLLTVLAKPTQPRARIRKIVCNLCINLVREREKELTFWRYYHNIIAIVEDNDVTRRDWRQLPMANMGLPNWQRACWSIVETLEKAQLLGVSAEKTKLMTNNTNANVTISQRQPAVSIIWGHFIIFSL